MEVTETQTLSIRDKSECIEKQLIRFMNSSGILCKLYILSDNMYALSILKPLQKKRWGRIIKQAPTTVNVGSLYISFTPRYSRKREFDTIYIEIDIKPEMYGKDIFKSSVISFLNKCKYKDNINLTINILLEKC